jgi:hypothetical protein
MFGRNLLTTDVVAPTRVTADGEPNYKVGGIGIDWTSVAAVAGSDASLPDGSIIRIGTKYIRYGQVMVKITASGKYGPYDPAAVDGRQTLARGSAYIMDETVLQYSAGVGAISVQNDQYGSAIEGGALFLDRIIQSGVVAASLALGPTLATLEATFPAARWVRNA